MKQTVGRMNWSDQLVGSFRLLVSLFLQLVSQSVHQLVIRSVKFVIVRWSGILSVNQSFYQMVLFLSVSESFRQLISHTVS